MAFVDQHGIIANYDGLAGHTGYHYTHIDYTSSTLMIDALKSLLSSMQLVRSCKHCGIHCIIKNNDDMCEDCVFETVLHSFSSEECCICLQCATDVSARFINLRCGHRFHRTCLINIENKICPLCQHQIECNFPDLHQAMSSFYEVHEYETQNTNEINLSI